MLTAKGGDDRRYEIGNRSHPSADAHLAALGPHDFAHGARAFCDRDERSPRVREERAASVRELGAAASAQEEDAAEGCLESLDRRRERRLREVERPRGRRERPSVGDSHKVTERVMHHIMLWKTSE
jgi:hypothetical protein